MMSLLFPWCTVEQVEHARKQEEEVEASPKPLAHRKSGGGTTVHTQLSQGDISGWLEDEAHVLT